MGLPIFDCAVRTSVVTASGAMVQLVPPAGAVGTGRMVRLRQLLISNTTVTAFACAFGLATVAAVTPATAGVIAKRSQQDPASVSAVWTTFGTTPTAPNGVHGRLWIPASGRVIVPFNEGEELLVPPASTPLPFCIWNIGTGQICDVTLSWEE